MMALPFDQVDLLRAAIIFATFGLAIFLLIRSIHILPEYERAVVFLLGRFQVVGGPGIVFVVPLIQTFVRVDMRIRVLDVPTQDLITRDNVSVKTNAIIYYKVQDPARSVIIIQDVAEAMTGLSATMLRSTLGRHDLDYLLTRREEMNRELRANMQEPTADWGVALTNVEVREVILDEAIVRAMAQQAEAERTRRARIIEAEGELQAAERLNKAANILTNNSQGLVLRYLSSLERVAGDRTSTIVFPVPQQLFDLVPLLGDMARARTGRAPSGSAPSDTADEPPTGRE